MSDEQGMSAATVLKGDVRPAPAVTRAQWVGDGQRLMVAVLVLLGMLLLMLALLGGWIVQRTLGDGDRVASTPRADDAPPPAPAAASMDPADWITADDYPVDALRNNEQGIVKIAWAVTPAGRVRDCHVEQSSGHASLDAAACRAITRSGRYPAASPDKPPRVFSRRVVWKIPEAAAGQSYAPTKPIDVATTAMQDNAAEVAITVGYDGKAESCRVVRMTAPAGADPCAATPPGTPMGTGFVRHGRPIKAVVHRAWSLRTTFE